MDRIQFAVISLLLLARPFLEALGNHFEIKGMTADSVVLAGFLLLLLACIGARLAFFSMRGPTQNLDQPLIWLAGAYILFNGLSAWFSKYRILSLADVGAESINICVLVLTAQFLKPGLIRPMLLVLIAAMSLMGIDVLFGVGGQTLTLAEQNYRILRFSGYFTEIPPYVVSQVMLFLFIALLARFVMCNLEDGSPPFGLSIRRRFFFIIPLMGVYLTGYRSTLFSIALLMLLLILLKREHRTANLLKTALLATAALLLIRHYHYDVFLRILESFNADYYTSDDMTYSTLSIRKYMLEKYLFNFSVPPLGFGQRTFSLYNIFTDPGSLWANLWFSTGYVGFAAYLALYARLAAIGLKNMAAPMGKLFLAMIAVVFVISFTESSTLSIRGLYFFCLTGTMISAIRQYRAKEG